MLKLSPAVAAKDIPGPIAPMSYTLYPDTEDRDLYYALADEPTYQTSADGGPSFNLTWYFGPGLTGGICTLTVALPVPDTGKQEVADKLAAALTKDRPTINLAQKTDALCRALLANDAAKANALKAELGLNDKAADQKKSQFDPKRDWQQFLPARGSLKISPVPFKTGTVTVQAFATPQAYQDGTPEFTTGKIQTTPSLVNSNAAVITFNLKDVGANLFWQGMGGWDFDGAAMNVQGFDPSKKGSSVFTVTYNVSFDGMLPEAKATVTLDKSIFAKLDIEKISHKSWGRTYSRDVQRGKEYNEAIASATTIVLPTTATKEEKDSVEKLLTDWAAKQLEDMTKSQFPAIKLEDLNIDTVRQLKAVTNQSRTYSLSKAVSVPKNPQAQLPKIGGLVDKASLPKYFQLIDLNRTPHFDVDLTVRPPNLEYLKARSIERFVVTELSYGNVKLRDPQGKEISTLQYPVGGPQAPGQTLSGTFDKRTPDKTLRYSYLVAYTDGTPSLRVAGNNQSGSDNYLDLGGVDIGALSVGLNGIDLPWDVIASAKVDLKYGDWEKSVTISRNDGTVLVVKPFGKQVDGSLTYKLTLNLTSGAPVAGPEIAVKPVRGHADVTLRNPIGDVLYSIIVSLDSAVTVAQLRAQYTMRSSGPDRIFNQLIQLNSATAPTYTWKVPVVSGYDGAFKITKARVTSSGKPVDLTNFSGADQDPIPMELPITVFADSISEF